MKIFLHMSRLFIILNILRILLLETSALEPLGERPPTGILDDAGLLSEEQETLLATKLRTSFNEHHLEVYIAAYQLVKGENIAERATRLRYAWARDPFAIVLVYDETIGQMSFVGTRDLEKFVSAQQLSEAFQRATAVAKQYLAEKNKADSKPVPGEMILRTTSALLADPILTERMTLSKPFHFTASMAKLLVLFVLAALAAAACVVWLEKRAAASKKTNQRCSYFPSTHMPIRLGAPYSGGKGVSFGD
ncbi:MAG: hypothetical protein ACI8T1_003047 [Verrucomicrobiales bacterium]|jgi:hypothetical protein